MGKLGILFDIDKLDSVTYGSVAWEIFWRALGPDGLADGVRLYEGDTAATLVGREQVYCLAIEAADATVLDAIRAKLTNCDEYLIVAAGPRLITGAAVEREPLPLMGHFEKGQIVGEHAINPRAALAQLRRESTPPVEAAAESGVSERPRPASPRSGDLPEVADLEGLVTLLSERFAGQAHPMRFALTPEELCDVVERNAEVFDVEWHVGVATVAESAAFVNLMPKGEHATKLSIFGLMNFPSRKDAKNYCERESITPQEWGLHGTLVRNFVGLAMVEDVFGEPDDDDLATRLVSANELWTHICARRRELKVESRADGDGKPWWRFWG